MMAVHKKIALVAGGGAPKVAFQEEFGVLKKFLEILEFVDAEGEIVVEKALGERGDVVGDTVFEGGQAFAFKEEIEDYAKFVGAEGKLHIVLRVLIRW
jgi:hypothetical protein